MPQTPDASANMRWLPWFALGALSAFLGMFLEWLFFVTKLSFLSTESVLTRAVALLAAPLPLMVVAAVVTSVAWAVSRAGNARAPHLARALAAAPAMLYSSVLCVLLFDNFTNIVLGFSIQTTTGGLRWAYVLLLPVAAVAGWSAARALLRRLYATPVLVRAGLGLTAVAVAAAGYGAARDGARTADAVFDDLAAPVRQPNILLFGSDGVDARRTSAYGYARPTTPNLARLAETGLVCENAFANSSHTTGSLISILTGRSPLATRVVFPPDILTGEDAFRHFPGMLRRWGYTNLHVSIRHFADAYDLNLRDGFDVSTFQRPSRIPLQAWMGETSSYLLRATLTRVRDRVLHIVGASSAPAAILEVQQPAAEGGLWNRPESIAHADSARVRALVDFVRETPSPWFAHVHLMASHGPKFPIARPVFSRGGRQSKPWLPDYYDDAVLQSDRFLGRILQVLDEQGVRENTVVVVYSDHGMRGSVRQRTPLVFDFPADEHVGRITRNAQNLDIVPTLLDYMGVEPPAWTSGRSLLRPPRTPASRAIFAASCAYEAWVQEGDRVWVDPSQVGPPFHSLRYVTVVACSRAYTVDLTQKQVQFEDVEGHTRPCPVDALPHPQTAMRTVVELLRAHDYDVTSFGIRERGGSAPNP